MIERPTPETDKRTWSDHSEGILYEVVQASFARKLERERDKAREDATNYYAKIGELEHERDNAIADRDILRINAQREAEHHDRILGKFEKVYKERDEAREVLREIAAADWKTSGELRGMARKALEVAK